MAATLRKKTAAKPKGLPEGFRLTHPDRVVYPEQGLTKRGIAEYYARVADWLLPHVAGRPLAFVRCPVGLEGQCFFQKHPPEGLPAAVERIQIREKTETDTYLVIHDLDGLLSLVQFGALEIHAWGARADDVERPDRLVFDLDPDADVAWKVVVDTALVLREALSQLGLESFVKTTGGKGLHVVVPINRRQTWKEVKPFCRDVAQWITSMAPERFTTNMSKAVRRGRIFIDYLRNERGATAVCPYSTRARPAASVAVPLTWEELRKTTGPQTFDVGNVPQRLTRLRRDPWAGMLRLRQSLTAGAIKRAALLARPKG